MSTDLAATAAPGADLAVVWTVSVAAQLASDRLLLIGTFPGCVDHDTLVFSTPDGELRARVRAWGSEDAIVLVVHHDGTLASKAATLAHPELPMSSCRVPISTDDLGSFLRSGVAALPPRARAELHAFLVDACLSGRSTLGAALAEDMHALRQVLRPRLQPGLIAADEARGLKLEVTAAIDDVHFYVRGWIGHPTDALTSVVAVSPEGVRAELVSSLHRYRRDDVAQFYGEDEDRCGYGFACQFTLPVQSVHGRDWIVEVTPRDGRPVEAAAPDVVSNIEAVRDLLIADLAIEPSPEDTFRRSSVAPAIKRLLHRSEQRVKVRHVEQLGRAPASPTVTVVVPLYKRVDFVEHQLAQFAHDDEMHAADLLYVLDSPELGEALLGEARRLYRLYRVPFRVALLSHNGGFAVANNLGASLAHSRLLLLMNSDVLPDRPRWLAELVTFYDSRERVGAIGPKLVYEDESIQHAGMYFERLDGSLLWSNEHFFKGLHRSFPAACVSRPVPAVTAACMLISTELYRRFGGLRGTFVQGDFEDSDLCLRLADAGYQHWYAANVELYHLEGQSYASWQRTANAEFNRWLHTDLWDAEIERLMAEHATVRDE